MFRINCLVGFNHLSVGCVPLNHIPNLLSPINGLDRNQNESTWNIFRSLQQSSTPIREEYFGMTTKESKQSEVQAPLLKAKPKLSSSFKTDKTKSSNARRGASSVSSASSTRHSKRLSNAFTKHPSNFEEESIECDYISGCDEVDDTYVKHSITTLQQYESTRTESTKNNKARTKQTLPNSSSSSKDHKWLLDMQRVQDASRVRKYSSNLLKQRLS